MQMNELKAIVAVGRIGMELAASRLMSLVLGSGVVALAGYVIYSPSWQGVAVVGLVSACGLLPSLRYEQRPKQEPTDGQ